MKKLVLEDGRELPLDRWLTVAAYCKRFNVAMSTVSSWIERDKLPADKVIIIPELNNMKLLVAEQYKV